MDSRKENLMSENFIQLTSEDKVLLEAFNNVGKKEVLIKRLVDVDPKCLFRLSENQQSFKNFCEKNMKFNLALIKNKRIPEGYPQQFIKSRNSKEKCSPFKIFMGALLWSEFEKYKEMKELPKEA